MPNNTAPYARNTIKRTLRAIVDAEPSKKEVAKIWNYFRSECAYCGMKLVPRQRVGHIDHLVAWANGGSNHISNRVLACRTCNSDEKLDSDWRSFLVTKNSDEKQLSRRMERIELWKSQNGNPPSFDLELIETETTKAIKAFDGCVERIRKVKK